MERQRQEVGAADCRPGSAIGPQREAARSAEPLGQVTLDPAQPDLAPGGASSPADTHESDRTWGGNHPIDFRISVWLPFLPFYVTIVAGQERRSKKRRQQDRRKHPLLTLGNMIFMGYSGAVIAIALGAIALTATIFIIQRLFEIEITLR